MKKLIAVVFVVSMISVSAKAENAPAQTGAPATNTHTSNQAVGNLPYQPIGKTFADTVNAYKPSVPPCIPQQGAQGFSSSVGGYGGF